MRTYDRHDEDIYLVENNSEKVREGKGGEQLWEKDTEEFSTMTVHQNEVSG